VLYEQRNADQLAELLPRLGAETLLADPGRPFARDFLTRFDVDVIGERLYRLR
jgi:hypothetical protein